jgi:hypothetical protein
LISILRSVLHTFRSLVRRAGLHKRHGAEPCFSVIAGPDGYRIRAASAEVAIEYQQPGQFDGETILLPVKALDAWNGRGNEQVALEQRPEHRALATWSDRGVPRQTEFHVGPKDKVTFPDPPTTYVPNEPGLWPALRSERRQLNAVRFELPAFSRFAGPDRCHRWPADSLAIGFSTRL